jgi:sarcosine oxidase subunit gamma
VRFRSALQGVLVPGRHGRASGSAGVVVRELPDCGLATLTAKRGRSAELSERILARFALVLPTSPHRMESREWAFVWTGPDQWLACAAPTPAGGMETALADVATGVAAVVDQSHARILLHLSGSRVRDALAKGLPLDLHPRAFPPGHAASTLCAHVAVTLWRTDDDDAFVVSVARGFALSFWEWLEASSAEYGLEVGPSR